MYGLRAALKGKNRCLICAQCMVIPVLMEAQLEHTLRPVMLHFFTLHLQIMSIKVITLTFASNITC